MMMGKGSVSHNNRTFTAKNVDAGRTQDNQVFVKENLETVYHNLFGNALAAYNAKQNRTDRKIDSYYEKIRLSRQEKLFHELVVQIGNKDDTNCRLPDGQTAALALTDYMGSFQERNRNLRVFNAVLHMDEETPHLHIDFVPFSTGNRRGLETKVSLKGALKELGFTGTGRHDTEWGRWVADEKEHLAGIMKEHGINWLQKNTHEKHLSVYNYEKKKRKEEIAVLDNDVFTKKNQLYKQETEIQARKAVLANLEEYTIKKEKEAAEARQQAELAVKETTDRKKKLEQSLEAWKLLETSAKNSYVQYSAMAGYKKEGYENFLKKKEAAQKDLKETSLKLKIVNYELRDAMAKLDSVQHKTQETVGLAEKLYKKYYSVAVTERQYQMFEDMLDMKRKNMQIEAENKKLQEKLQKAYSFMKQVTINGTNMLEHFLNVPAEKIRQFTAGTGRH